jgi:hypothetical protein
MPSTNWIIFTGVILVTLLLAGCQFVAASHPPARPLQEWGTIAIPKRLELRQRAIEHPTYALHHFERVANSIFLIGSNTPIAEKLIVAAWTNTKLSHAEAREAAIRLAQDRIGNLTWLTADTAEGIHEVNTAKHPAWLVVTESPAHQLTLAYMVWKKDAPSTAAEILARAQTYTQSFKSAMTAEAYLNVAADRPAHQRARRLADVDAILATRNIHLKLDAGPVDNPRDGGIYELYTETRVQGRLLTVLLPLGTLPKQDSYKHLRPIPPAGISNLPNIQYFSHRDHNGLDDKLLLSERTVAKALSADPHNVKFYTANAYLIDDLDMPEPDLDYFWKAHNKIRPIFAEGKLVR